LRGFVGSQRTKSGEQRVTGVVREESVIEIGGQTIGAEIEGDKIGGAAGMRRRRAGRQWCHTGRLDCAPVVPAAVCDPISVISPVRRRGQSAKRPPRWRRWPLSGARKLGREPEFASQRGQRAGRREGRTESGRC